MRRKHDAHKDEVEGVAQRLRNERPEASPLELDQIKTSAMSRAKAGARRGRAGARRLATAGLTLGLLAAGTGGVIAGQGSDQHGGNAADTQYGNNCTAGNNNGNGGNGGNGGKGGSGGSANGGKGGSGHHGGEGGDGGEGGSGGEGGFGGEGGSGGSENGNFNCNENSFNTTTNTTTITINQPVVTIMVPVPTGSPSSSVLGSKSTKATTSKRHIKLHINVSRKSKLKKVTLRVNGKIVKVLKGKQASANINLVNLPCSNGTTTVTITAVTGSGKTITESHTYHLCQA